MSSAVFGIAELPDSEITVRINSASSVTFPGKAAVIIETGAARLQSYANAAELRRLAHAATLAAEALDMEREAA